MLYSVWRHSVKSKNWKEFIIKTLIISLVFLIVPYALPYTFELLMMLDLAGLEAALVFLILQAKPIRSAISIRIHNWKYHFGITILLLAGIYMFQSDAYLLHSLGSMFILICTCSSILALAVWLPAMYLSYKEASLSYITIPLIPPLAGTPPAASPH